MTTPPGYTDAEWRERKRELRDEARRDEFEAERDFARDMGWLEDDRNEKEDDDDDENA